MSDPKIKISDVKKLFIQFVKEEVHGGDFDQLNTEKQTIDIFKRWWDRKESKIKRLTKWSIDYSGRSIDPKT